MSLLRNCWYIKTISPSCWFYFLYSSCWSFQNLDNYLREIINTKDLDKLPNPWIRHQLNYICIHYLNGYSILALRLRSPCLWHELSGRYWLWPINSMAFYLKSCQYTAFQYPLNECYRKIEWKPKMKWLILTKFGSILN